MFLRRGGGDWRKTKGVAVEEVIEGEEASMVRDRCCDEERREDAGTWDEE